MNIYLIGILVAFLVGLFSLTFTKDNECNVTKPECVAIVMTIAMLSWIAVAVLISSEIRTRFVVDEDK